MTDIDHASHVRDGEQLDADALAAWFAAHAPELAPDGGNALGVRQFPGGASNLTYSITVNGRDYVLRRPPFGSQVKSAHDMGREFNVLSRLQGVYAYAPRPVAHCTDDAVIGAEFYVMERLRGIILRRDLPPNMNLPADDAARLCEQLLDVQAALHTIDVDAAGMRDFGKPAGYIERQITGWNRRFVDARTDDVPACDGLMRWLETRMPADPGRAAIIHNDYKLDNVVLDAANPTRISGVLDWEMATVGDPVMDFACAMSYWVQADDPAPLQRIRMGPTQRPGMLTRDEMLARYRDRTGLAIDDWPFYQVFGLFRLAVIAQQIYKRYVDGKTRDKRFAAFGPFVAVLSQQCERIMAEA